MTKLSGFPTANAVKTFFRTKAILKELKRDSKGVSKTKATARQKAKQSFIDAAQLPALASFDEWMSRHDDDDDKRRSLKYMEIIFEFYESLIIYHIRFKTKDGEKYSLNDGVLENPIDIYEWKKVESHIEVYYKDCDDGAFKVKMEDINLSFTF